MEFKIPHIVGIKCSVPKRGNENWRICLKLYLAECFGVVQMFLNKSTSIWNFQLIIMGGGGGKLGYLEVQTKQSWIQ